MSNVDNANKSLLQLSDILGKQFKAPEIFGANSNFSKLKQGISDAQAALRSLLPNASKSEVLLSVEKALDTALGNKELVNVASDNLKFNLPLTTAFSNGLPKITATIDSTFSFDTPLPNLTFKVGLDTGSFVDNFTKPVLGEIKKVIDPINAIEDVLRTNLPGLDSIGINVNLLGIANSPALNTFFDTVDQVSLLVDAANTLGANGKTVELGEFTLNGDGISGSSPQADIVGKLDQSFASFLDTARSKGGLTFPLLERPSTAFDLLLGSDVDLLNFTIPGIEAFEAKYSAPPIIIPIPPLPIPLVGQLAGGVTLGTSGLRFGFDTYGLKQNDPLKGLFIDSSKPIFQVSPELSASLRAEAYIAAGGAKVSVKGDVGFYLPESPENKFRIADSSNFSNFDVKGGTIDLTGSIFGRIGPPISFLSKTVEADLFNIKLFDFSGGSGRSGGKFIPNLATYDSSSQILRLNMGAEADRNRRKVKAEEIKEEYTITGDNNSLTVAAFSYQEKFSNVIKIVALADTGNDTIIINANVPSELYGGSGKDTLRGGSSTDVLHGEEDDDTLNGNAGDDFLFGDQGKDALFGEDGIDRIWGGDGEDTLNGGLQGDFLYGGDGKDVLVGDGQGNTLAGGDDLLDGGAGDDLLFGEAGNDEIYGNDGNDFLDGGFGNDLINGGNGFDTVSYENTPAALASPDGLIVNIDETRDYRVPGKYLYSNASSSVVVGFDFNLGNSIAKGTATSKLGDQDTLVDLEGIIGSNLDDVLIGNGKDNTIQGLSGNDILIGSSGTNTLDGGDGTDTLSYQYSLNAILVNLVQGTATTGFDTSDSFLNIENIIGSDKDDRIVGNFQENWLFGGNGKDTIQAGAGNDRLIGGADADGLDGGEGFDTASYSDAITGIVANLSNSQTNTGDAQGDSYISIEYLEGSQFADVLVGNGKGNHIWGLRGNDSLDGLGGSAMLMGGLDNDTYRMGNLATQIIELLDEGFDTVDSLIDYTLPANLEQLNLLEGTAARNGIGNELGNIINGNSVDNILNGEAGKDFLYGFFGKDTLNGGDDDDYLMGGRGNDILTGGNGNDTFAYTDITDAGDMIMDFTIGRDKIEMKNVLRKYGYSGSQPLNDGYLSVRQVNAGLTSLQIDLDGFGNTYRPVPFVLLKNVQASSLDINSFTSFAV